MKKSLIRARSMPPVLAFCLFTVLAPLSGCISDDDYDKAVTQFQQSSNTLTQVFQTLMINANITEENHYIDGQAFEGKPIDSRSIQSVDLYTAEEIRLRTCAIQALADYTAALATLAAGKPEAQVRSDASKASSSLKTLTSDATSALVHPTAGSKTADYSGPVSSAVDAIGQVISLIEKHHGETEVRESIRKNDPQLKALFDLISKESTELYARQKATLGATGDNLFFDYAQASKATPVNSATLIELSDRIKQFRKDSALLSDGDPAKAIGAFQKSHDALVAAILAPKEKKKESLAQLITAVKAFASEVSPLAQDVYAFGKSF